MEPRHGALRSGHVAREAMMKPGYGWVFTALLCMALGLAGVATAGEREAAAQEAAERWLLLVDDGEYVSSWNEAAEAFRAQLSPEAWEQAVGNARDPLGEVLARSLVVAQYASSLPGVPDGDYVVMQYSTRFEHKADGVETVTARLEDGDWRVIGYFVR